MKNEPITVNTMLDDKIFRRFAVFDNMYRQRRWVSPVIFASIMTVFACVCFFVPGPGTQPVMLGCVLLVIGFGLPAMNMRSFFASVKKQIKAHKLEKPQHVYSLKLSSEPDGVRVTNPGGESAQYEWGKLWGAYRVDGCIYLYVVNSKAFLLPDGQAEEGTEALWSLLTDMLPKEKLHDRRKVKNT